MVLGTLSLGSDTKLYKQSIRDDKSQEYTFWFEFCDASY